MKKLLCTCVLLLAFAPAASAGFGYVKVDYNGETTRLKTFDFDGVTVCALKQNIAGLFNLDMKKFDLKKGGSRLKGDVTLEDARIFSGNTLAVVASNHSGQC